jgi:hypothetical protein
MISKKRKGTMYRSLREALHAVQPTQIVVAEDVSASGQKCFRVGSVDVLESMYTSLSNPHWYECLVENKPSRLFLDVESTGVVDIGRIVAWFANAVQTHCGRLGQFEIIDSSSSQKSSWHVVCTNVYLQNVYHVGAFVRRTVLSMVHSGDESLTANAPAIDTAVYTKNRMFRVNGSTKYGSSRVLKHPLPWSALLVQSPQPIEVVITCLEIDGSEPGSTSADPTSLFQYDEVGDQWLRTSGGPMVSTPSKVSTSCSLLWPILDWLDQNLQARISRHKLSMTENGYFVVPACSTKCAIAGRCHRSNKIWFSINTTRQTVRQKCLDSDCGGQCRPVYVPSSLWDRWNKTWHQLEVYRQ